MTQREEFESAFKGYNLVRSKSDSSKYGDKVSQRMWEAYQEGFKAAKAQAVPCQNVNETINNSMPRGYMLNTLIKFQEWRIGEDVRTLDETGLTPRSITLAIDWAIEQLDKYKTQAVPEQQK